MKKTWLITGIVFLLAFVAIQFYRPEMTNPAIDPAVGSPEQLHADPEVEKILRAACFDCHSHETVWPWYGSVAPSSWLIARDVSRGRKHLNFSIWGKYSRDRKLVALNDIVEQVTSGEMPLGSYKLLHAGARLDSSTMNAVVEWALRERARHSSEP